MRTAAIVAVILFTLLYAAIAVFGFVMSVFCFDPGTGQSSWNCFYGINGAVIVPSILCIIAGIVLIVLRRYRAALIVSALPAIVVAIGFVAVWVANLTYFWGAR